LHINRFPGDGSAVLWKRDRFDLVSVVGKPFDAKAPDASAASAAAAALGASSASAPATAAAAASSVGGGGGGGRRGVQGLLLVTLRDKRDSGRKIVVACVHLKAKEGAANDAVRAAQAREAVRALEEAAGSEEAGQGGGEFSPISSSRPPPTVAVLAGDFNAEPGSAPHEAVRSSGLPLRCLWECEREEEGGGREAGGGAAPAASCRGRGGGAGGAAPAAAAAAAAAARPAARLPPVPRPPPPPYTTYKFRSEDSESDASDGARGATARGTSGGPADGSEHRDQLSRRVSDFVFFSSGSAAAVARWAPLDFEGELRDGLPCERYPSDHAAVLAVLRPKGK